MTIPVPDDIYTLGESLQVFHPIPVPDDIYTFRGKPYRGSTPFQFQMISTHSGNAWQRLHPIPVPDDIYTLGESLTEAPPHSSSRWYLHTQGKPYRGSTPFQFQMISTHLGKALQRLHPIPVPDDIYTLGESLTEAPPHSSSRWYLHTWGKPYRGSTPFQFQMISTHLGKALQRLHPIPVPDDIYTHGESHTDAPSHSREVPPVLHNFQTVAMMVWLMIMVFNVHSKKECQACPLSIPLSPRWSMACVLACRCACTRVCMRACVIMCCQSYCKVLCTPTSCERWSAAQILFIIKQLKCKTSPRKWRTKTFILF